MLKWVKALEGKSAPQRRDVLEHFFRENSIAFEVHPFTTPGCRSANLIVYTGSGKEDILVTAHYDSVPGSPGANDNASSVAVLMKLCQAIKSSNPDFAIKFIFTDGEEALTRVGPFRRGCRGSRAYLKDYGWKNIRAVYNLEWCGDGDFVGIWPVDENVRQTFAFKVLERVLKDSGHPYGTADIPRLVVCSDHRPFRQKGVAGAFSISLLPGDEIETLRHFFSSKWEVLKFLFSSRKRRGPQKSPLFKRLHSGEDSSTYLREESMQMIFNIMYKTLIVFQ